MYSDLIDAVSNEKLAFLSLLDLTAAFDTVDHAILLQRLETTFGFRGTTLKWLSSYLEGRTQSVHLNGQSTDPGGGGGFRRSSGFCAGTSAVHTLHSRYRQSDQTVWSESSYLC